MLVDTVRATLASPSDCSVGTVESAGVSKEMVFVARFEIPAFARRKDDVRKDRRALTERPRLVHWHKEEEHVSRHGNRVDFYHPENPLFAKQEAANVGKDDEGIVASSNLLHWHSKNCVQQKLLKVLSFRSDIPALAHQRENQRRQ